MTKKDYVLKMLTLLESTRYLAKWLKLVIEANEVNEGILDMLITTFQITAKNMKDENTKALLEKGAAFLQKMKTIEAESKIQDQKDTAELDKMLLTM